MKHLYDATAVRSSLLKSVSGSQDSVALSDQEMAGVAPEVTAVEREVR